MYGSYQKRGERKLKKGKLERRRRRVNKKREE